MRFLLRHPASFLLVLSACAAVGAVFVFARPAYHPRYESKMLDFSTVRHYSPDAVRDAFAAHGVQLRMNSHVSGITMFSTVPVPDGDALQVLVAPREGKGSWGPKLEPYDERFGNVLVTYGGHDAKLLGRVKTSVSSLRSA